jgi:hypothetical protein
MASIFGWGRNPETGWDVGFSFQHLTGSTEVANIGHARADKDFIDLSS